MYYHISFLSYFRLFLKHPSSNVLAFSLSMLSFNQQLSIKRSDFTALNKHTLKNLSDYHLGMFLQVFLVCSFALNVVATKLNGNLGKLTKEYQLYLKYMFPPTWPPYLCFIIQRIDCKPTKDDWFILNE